MSDLRKQLIEQGLVTPSPTASEAPEPTPSAAARPGGTYAPRERSNHSQAEVTLLDSIDLPSGRQVRFEALSFAHGVALGITERQPDGREHYVRVPLGCIANLRSSIGKLGDLARERALKGDMPPKGSR